MVLHLRIARKHGSSGLQSRCHCHCVLSLRFSWAIPENREIKKWKFSFFCQRHARHVLSTSFDTFVATYRVTNFLPKLMDMLLFSVEKNEFPFLVFPYFRVMPFSWQDIFTLRYVSYKLNNVLDIERHFALARYLAVSADSAAGGAGSSGDSDDVTRLRRTRIFFALFCIQSGTDRFCRNSISQVNKDAYQRRSHAV